MSSSVERVGFSLGPNGPGTRGELAADFWDKPRWPKHQLLVEMRVIAPRHGRGEHTADPGRPRL